MAGKTPLAIAVAPMTSGVSCHATIAGTHAANAHTTATHAVQFTVATSAASPTGKTCKPLTQQFVAGYKNIGTCQ